MQKVMYFIFRTFRCFDWPLLCILILLGSLGMTIMHSAVGGTDWRFADQARNYLIAFFVMWALALTPPPLLMRLALPMYIIGVTLLIAVLLFGITNKGATRWLSIGGMQVQPSELLKLSVPMMLAWYFDKNRGNVRAMDFIVAGILLLIPFLLIVKQPDLGTALLVFATGFFVLYYAGLSFKLLAPIFILGIVGISLILYFEPVLCQPSFDWVILHDYQKQRVCTLLDPNLDPLGKGFHTIQGMIAIGSGGVYGKGYMQGTQTHLDFIPERTTDFIFAVFAEEFGLYGAIMMLILYSVLLLRGLYIAANAKTQFGRLLAGAMTMMFFVYAFVNMGMVMGILPIVGVPLPFMSYGGTALVTLGFASGILMSISNYKPSKPDNPKSKIRK